MAYMRSLYENNVAHKDLKPDNILVKKVDGDYIIKIGDFGISKHQTIEKLNPINPNSVIMKGTAGTHGSVGYMSPQQAKMQ